MNLDLRSSELEHDFLKERIGNVEKHISAINSDISSYLAQQAHVRDSGDKLAKTIVQFASKETQNQTLRAALGEFSDILATVQEYREMQIRRTEAKVVSQFSKYDNICKQAKDDLKRCADARAKELKKKNCLEKARSKNPNWQKIAEVEKEVTEAQDLANRTTQDLSKQMDHFEKQKLDDIKKGFLEFINIEMLFNSKCIELYTKAFNVVKSINSEEDLKEFRCHFKAHTSTLDAETLTPLNDNTRPKTNSVVNTSTPPSVSMPPKIASTPRRPILTVMKPPRKLEYSASGLEGDPEPNNTSQTKGSKGQIKDKGTEVNMSTPSGSMPPKPSFSRRRFILTVRNAPLTLECSTSELDSVPESRYECGD